MGRGGYRFWGGDGKAEEPKPPHSALKIIKEQEHRQAGFSEWVEREGRAWEEGVSSEDGLRAFLRWGSRRRGGIVLR